jgi:hypothetical protein
MDIEKDAGMRRVIWAQRKVMQIHRMACRRRKRQVNIEKIRKRVKRNVEIGNGT